jgi:ABC-2 type transport system ATP-binding protein
MSDPLVTAHGLGKSFGRKTVFSNLSFQVEAGDVVGVLGKNGAGKTTLLEIMLGFSPASSGTVQVFGHDSFRLPAAAKARIGFVSQQDELLDPLRAIDQLRAFGAFYPRWDEDLIARLCTAWEVDSEARIKTLSVGQRQKLSILLALGHHPDLLILDEPVASLDPLGRRRFLEQIIDIVADRRRAVVLSSHIVSDIERLANKIWILKDGALHWAGDTDALKERVVRLHIRTAARLPESLPLPNLLSIVHEDGYLCAIATDWSAAAAARLRDEFGITPEVETLALEDIFLELHR